MMIFGKGTAKYWRYDNIEWWTMVNGLDKILTQSKMSVKYIERTRTKQTSCGREKYKKI